MFAKVKYLLAIGFLFLIPACATESSTQVANIDSSDEVSVVKEVAEIVNTATPIPPTPKPTNISNNSGNDYYPSWSPDGTKIVFTSKKIFTSKIDYMQIFTIKLD